jgi:polysaccharide pyruvyl transferase CsaB
VALALLLKKPVIFYAQGVGPINRRFSKFLMRRIANRVDMITLRDEDSVRVLQQIGVTHPPVRVTADPVFSLEPKDNDYEAMGQLLRKYCPGPGQVVGVSVRQWTALEGYQRKLAQVLDGLVREGYQVLFIPMDYPADLEESRRIVALMEEPAALIDSYLTSHQHVALISNFQLMIGMRLHALIFSASQEVLFMGISYDPKIDSFLRQFGEKPLTGDAGEMAAQVRSLLADTGMQDKIRRKARELRTRAEETAHLALALCRSRDLN